MQNFFLGIVEITLGMSLLLPLMLLVLRLIGGKFTAKCRYILWTLVLVRLALPFSFGILPALIEVPVEPEPVPQIQETVQMPSIEYTPVITNSAPVQSQEPVQIPTLPAETPVIPEPAPVSITWEDISVYIPYLYLIGAAVFLVWNLLSYGIYTGRILRSAKSATSDTQEIYEALCRKKELHRPPVLLISPEVNSPAAFGLLQKRIVLPGIPFTENGLAGTLSHEVTHCKRGDLWIKAIALLARFFHWFNPLVHLAAFQCEMEMELSCDEAVLAGCSDETRAAYGEVMLDIIRRCRRNRGALTTHFNPKKNAVKARLQNILYGSGKRRGTVLIVLCLILCLIAGTIVACRVEGENASDDNRPGENDKTAENAKADTIFESELLKPKIGQFSRYLPEKNQFEFDYKKENDDTLYHRYGVVKDGVPTVVTPEVESTDSSETSPVRVTSAIYRCDDVYRTDSTPTHGESTITFSRGLGEFELYDCEVILCDDGCDPDSVIARAFWGYAGVWPLELIAEYEDTWNYPTRLYLCRAPEESLENMRGTEEQITAYGNRRAYLYLMTLPENLYAYICVQPQNVTAPMPENEQAVVDSLISSVQINLQIPEYEGFELVDFPYTDRVFPRPTHWETEQLGEVWMVSNTIPVFAYQLFEWKAHTENGETGLVWELCVYTHESYAEMSKEFSDTNYLIGTDEEYVYVLCLPTDVQYIENDPVSQAQYQQLQTESQTVLENFMSVNGITPNLTCPASVVYTPAAEEPIHTAVDPAAFCQTFLDTVVAPYADYIVATEYLDLDGNGITELILYDWGASANCGIEISTIENGEVRSFSTGTEDMVNFWQELDGSYGVKYHRDNTASRLEELEP